MDTAKKIFWFLLDSILAIAIIAMLFLLKAFWSYSDTAFLQRGARTIVVSAEGKATVIPNIAILSFSVISEGQDTKKISVENADKINKAIEFIKKQGIEAGDIQTAEYNLSPRYGYDEKRRVSFISGYTLTQTVKVKVRDFTKIRDIVSALPDYGINQIGSLRFDIEDPDRYLNEARGEAFVKVC